MITRRIIEHVKQITESALNEIYFLNLESEEIKEDQKWPLILCTCLKSEIMQDKDRTIYDVTIGMLQPMPVRPFGLSDLQFQNKIIEEQDEMGNVLENYVDILTGNEFNFPYQLESNAEFSYQSDFTDWNLLGAQVVFSISVQRKIVANCCIKFDKDRLKAIY